VNVEQSITRWIGELQEGGAEAAQGLSESYFQEMVDLAWRRQNKP
jgi:hypothetical protein